MPMKELEPYVENNISELIKRQLSGSMYIQSYFPFILPESTKLEQKLRNNILCSYINRGQQSLLFKSRLNL